MMRDKLTAQQVKRSREQQLVKSFNATVVGRVPSVERIERARLYWEQWDKAMLHAIGKG